MAIPNLQVRSLEDAHLHGVYSRNRCGAGQTERQATVLIAGVGSVQKIGVGANARKAIAKVGETAPDEPCEAGAVQTIAARAFRI